jgi:hypothetical protein
MFAVLWTKIQVIPHSRLWEALNRIDVYPGNRKEVVLGHGVTVLERDVVLVLGKRVKKSTLHYGLGYSAYLEDDSEVETLVA